MATSSSLARDRTLIVGLGLATFAIFGLIRHMLIHYRDAVEIKEPKPKPHYVSQSEEDALTPSTLEKLVDSHNYSIQELAARIVLDRTLHDQDATLDALLFELTRPDHDRRERAIRALCLLSEQSGWEKLNVPKVYSAIVTSLEYSLTDIQRDPYDKEFDNFDFRDSAERLCLVVLHRLANDFGPEGIVRSGFVHRWLAKEPWGNTEKEIQENFQDAMQRSSTTLAEIIMRVYQRLPGRRQLVKAKLLPEKRLFDDSDEDDEDIDIRMINGESTAGEFSLELSLTEGVRRSREQSAEERHLRRRHREVMVLNDGSQPIGDDDIIESVHLASG